MAAFAANLTISLTHESFHFRHLWLLLALIYATTSIDAGRSHPRWDDDGQSDEPIESKEVFDARV
jgi:hypothetical protein